MPLGIKDIIETADMPTENGSLLFAGWRSERDGASVAALREAGAVIVGKTVTTEFAATEPRGTRNPHDLRRTPGGSSSGSAAAGSAGKTPPPPPAPGDRPPHPPAPPCRRRRRCDQRSACAVDANQCLGMALAAQHLSRAGREKAQPGIA